MLALLKWFFIAIIISKILYPMVYIIILINIILLSNTNKNKGGKSYTSYAPGT